MQRVINFIYVCTYVSRKKQRPNEHAVPYRLTEEMKAATITSRVHSVYDIDQS